MKIVADANISLLHLFKKYGTVQTYHGHEICAAHLQEAEILLVRSQTLVDEKLLSGSKIKFIGSATSGTNHIDKEYLRTQGIKLAVASGCNADAVVTYVASAIEHLAYDKGTLLDDKVYGIVGMGHVGKKLYTYLKEQQAHILIYDPFSDHTKIAGADFVDLEFLVQNSDIISLHPALTLASASLWPSYHLINQHTLSLLKPKAWLINASRGDIIDETALLNFVEQHDDVAIVLDVFATEPVLRHELIKKLDIASCHIAGYGKVAKENASLMLLSALIKETSTLDNYKNSQQIIDSKVDLSAKVDARYNILLDDAAARDIAVLPFNKQAQAFYDWRKNYKLR